MKDSKLISVLSSFSPVELKEFEKFISSPYFNTGRKYLVRFFTIIRDRLKDENFTKEFIYQLMYPGESYNDTRMRKLTSGLQGLAEAFLSIDSFRKDKQEVKSYLLDQLGSRNLDTLFLLHHKEAEKMLEGSPARDDTYYYMKHRLERKIKYFYFSRRREKALEHFDSEIENYLKSFLIFMAIKYTERLKEKRSFTEKDFAIPMIEEVTAYIKKLDLTNEPVLNLYYTELMIYTETDKEHYYKLKELVMDSEKFLNSEDHKNLFSTLTNYAAEQNEKGEPGFLKEMFDLYNIIIEKDLVGQFISDFLFLNVVTVSLLMNDFSFAESFIEKYKERLNPQNASNIINYCYANIHFKKQEFGLSLGFLAKVNFQNNLHKSLVKNLTIKCYYELNEPEALRSAVNSYRQQLKRDKEFPPGIKTILYNFMQVVSELMDIKNGISDKDTIEIKKMLDTNAVAEKKWLMEKIEQL